MPTPFQHLVYARMILEDSRLPNELREQLQCNAGPFLLGNTAADVQTVTGDRRVTTHFFTIPPSGHPRAEVALLQAYPGLSDPRILAPEHAAFISGYLAHLVWDQRWAWDVYCRYYCNDPDDDWRIAAVEHNALRVLLDHHAEAMLHATPWILNALYDTQPDHWLPFIDGSALRTWQSWIVEQLAHPGSSQTAEVFAARNGVPVTHLESVTQRLRAQAESHTAPAPFYAVAPYETHALQESIAVLCRFWHCNPAHCEQDLPWLEELTLSPAQRH